MGSGVLCYLLPYFVVIKHCSVVSPYRACSDLTTSDIANNIEKTFFITHGLRIELKDESGGITSDDQKERLQMLSDEGYLAVIRSGYQAAFNELLDYMGIGR